METAVCEVKELRVLASLISQKNWKALMKMLIVSSIFLENLDHIIKQFKSGNNELEVSTPQLIKAKESEQVYSMKYPHQNSLWLQQLLDSSKIICYLRIENMWHELFKTWYLTLKSRRMIWTRTQKVVLKFLSTYRGKSKVTFLFHKRPWTLKSKF